MNEQETWDQLASNYDKTVGFFDHSYPYIRQYLNRDLGDRNEVLEVAAGSGQFTFNIAKVVTRLVATDVSSEMIRKLEAKLADRGIKNVKTAVMSAYELTIEDEHLDAVFCANALHVMETPQKALHEFKRVLRQGGRLILPTFCHGIDWRHRFLSWFLGLVTPFVAHTKFSPNSLRELVKESGFEIVELTLLPDKFPVAYLVADKPHENENTS